MTETAGPLRFSVSRNDLLFNYASLFSEVFEFSLYKTETARSTSGVRLQENSGFDFRNECSPIIIINPVGDILQNILGFDPTEFCANIVVEDIGLAIRSKPICYDLHEIESPERIEINLRSYKDLAFYRGFEIKCFISRKWDINPEQNFIWSKSQQIYHTSFVAKTSVEKSLFEITWVSFADEADKRDLLYFVDWISSGVSTELDVDCFQVKANSDLKDQFKRLENNRHFGEFCIRMIAEQILRELLIQCLKYAEIDTEPQTDSLHDKLSALLTHKNFDFNELARRYQKGDEIDQMSVASETAKLMQRIYKIGSTLKPIKFGGYR